MPRKRSPDSTSDRQRIQFAYNADCDTRIGEVFQYLLKSDKLPSRKGKHKGLDAMTAYWQAFACQENDALSDEEKGAIARESIEALSQQIDLIRETFGIEAPVNPVNPAQLKQEMRLVATAVVQEFVASGAIPASAVENVTTQTANAASTTVAKPAPSSDEGVDFDEEALLGGLFDSSEIAA
ncbi:hypothetical protein [Leptolyngbya sp. BC1307]|uniref:hypothetical protein n=1 Tax=Leptolyngbya sp. BC1307 TaxID=2029589 RepID=UPI000EFD39AF|nr:hypothetical protein [Leptolyngbya sp. BC1307]